MAVNFTSEQLLKYYDGNNNSNNNKNNNIIIISHLISCGQSVESNKPIQKLY